MNNDLTIIWGQALDAFSFPEMPYLMATAVALSAMLYSFRPEYRAALFHTRMKTCCATSCASVSSLSIRATAPMTRCW